MTLTNHIASHRGFRASQSPTGEPVYVDGMRLDLAESLAVWNHSPTGFAWGYGGSGPAQLALAILLRFAEPDVAVQLHQRFKADHVAHWPQDQPLDYRVDVRMWVGAQLRSAEGEF